MAPPRAAGRLDHHPGRRAAPSRDPGEYPASAGDAHEDNARSKPLRPSRWIPGSACGGPGMTSKAKHPSRRYAPLVTSSRTARPFFTDVIPDGAQRRAGIQTNAAQDPLDPHLRGDDKQKAKSSRTAGRADPESRWAHRKSYCMLACDLAVGTRRRAGLSSWDGTPLLVTSSRTARSAEPGSSALQRGLPECAQCAPATCLARVSGVGSDCPGHSPCGVCQARHHALRAPPTSRPAASPAGWRAGRAP